MIKNNRDFFFVIKNREIVGFMTHTSFGLDQFGSHEASQKLNQTDHFDFSVFSRLDLSTPGAYLIYCRT
jgi:hypothetical protein